MFSHQTNAIYSSNIRASRYYKLVLSEVRFLLGDSTKRCCHRYRGRQVNMVQIHGATHVSQWRRQYDAMVRAKANFKNRHSSDCALQLVHIREESLVIVHKSGTVNEWSSFAHTAHHTRSGVCVVCSRIGTTCIKHGVKDVSGCTFADLS